jgi:hypothetical protein
MAKREARLAGLPNKMPISVRTTFGGTFALDLKIYFTPAQNADAVHGSDRRAAGVPALAKVDRSRPV